MNEREAEFFLGDTTTIINYISQYSSSPSYYTVNGSAFVSTFEGAANAADWATIRAAVDIYFLPDWTSVGCGGISNYDQYIDGAFSWNAWPEGPNNIAYGDDQCWVNNLGDKKFMMSVSPWFYTNIPNYGKNWLWRGDSLWHDRWQEAITYQPDFVEIVSWNDYGESHYIGPVRSSGYYDRSGLYTANMPHDPWRDLLPYYIQEYKTGTVNVDKDILTFWYRLSPAAAGDNGGTVCNAAYQTTYAPADCVQDAIFVAVVIKSLPAQVSVRIGYAGYVTWDAYKVGVNFFQRPLYSQTGTVTAKIMRDGALVAFSSGDDIVGEPVTGFTNYNAFVGGA